MSNSFDITSSIKGILTSWTSGDVAVTAIKFAFISGLGIFLICLPFCRSRKSWWDPIAARKVRNFLRLFVFLEVSCLAILLGFYLSYGNAIYLHSGFSFGNGDSWLYGFARPSSGILLILFGFFGDMHPIPRIICLIGCGGELLGDALSAYQIHDQISQVTRLNAPSNGYSVSLLTAYFWRDLVSIALCTIVGMFVGYYLVMLGCFSPQLIHPALISGDLYDRYWVMHNNRELRKGMEKSGIIDSPPPPLMPRKTLKELIQNEFNHISNDLMNEAVDGVDEMHEQGLDVRQDDKWIIRYHADDLEEGKPIL